MQQVSNLC